MNARKKAAAVSAAGIMLIAGCSGGGKAGGGALPATPGQLTQGNQPPNSSKISVRFVAGSRKVTSWKNPAPYQPAYTARRPLTGKKSAASLARKQPKYITPAIMDGGTISIYVYQGANLALTNGPFTVGPVYGAYDFYCYFDVYDNVVCQNYSAVFAPYGNDTFFVGVYDLSHHLLSITPGMPGTNFYGASQPSYNITSSGYASPIAITTSAVAQSFVLDTPTGCIDPVFTPGVAETIVVDSTGVPIFGTTLANPITVTVTGGFQLYSAYAAGFVPTPYTIYNTYDALEIVSSSPSSGVQGSVSVSAPGSNVFINNNNVTSMNLTTVDRLALSPSAGGLNVLGLVDGPTPAAYSCGGTFPIASYTGSLVTGFTNPVAIAGDDSAAGAAVLENRSGTPYIDVISVNRVDYGFPVTFGKGWVNAQPVVQSALPGSGPLELAVSPESGGSSTIYVLNSDGSIQAVSTMYGTISTVEPAASVTGATGIDVQYAGSDTLLLTSSSSPTIFEVDSANGTPVLSSESMMTYGFSASTTTSAIAADVFDLSGAMFFAIHDPSAGPQNNLGACIISCVGNTTFYTGIGGNAIPVGGIGFQSVGGVVYTLVANGTQLSGFTGNAPPAAAGTFATFPSSITRIISTYDDVWSGIGYGGAFVFNYQLGPTVYVPSLVGTRAVIVR